MNIKKEVPLTDEQLKSCKMYEYDIDKFNGLMYNISPYSHPYGFAESVYSVFCELHYAIIAQNLKIKELEDRLSVNNRPVY